MSNMSQDWMKHDACHCGSITTALTARPSMNATRGYKPCNKVLEDMSLNSMYEMLLARKVFGFDLSAS